MGLLDVKLPGEIFSGDSDTLKSEYRELVRRYHPDVNKSPLADAEFQHLEKLHELAREQLDEDFWESKNSLRCSKYRMKYRRKVELPIGAMYVGDTHVTFMIKKSFKALWDNGMRAMKGFRYKNEKMKKEISRYLPSIKVSFEIPNYNVLVLNKTPDMLLLRDIPILSIAYSDKHIAWIVSTMHNLLCYLEVSGITHNDISLDTYFVSFEFHSGALLGGWWYSVPKGNKLISVPKSSYDYFTPAMRKSLIADPLLDKELMRAAARELLGDRLGSKLRSGAPEPMLNWLKCATSKTAIQEYSLWGEVLTKSFGERKFIKEEVTADRIYA